MTRTIDIIELLTNDPWMAVVVDVTCKATCVLLLACVTNWFLRRRSAAARHLVWCLALLSLPLIPALACTLPSWKISVYESSVAPDGRRALIVMPPSWAETLANIHHVSRIEDVKVEPEAMTVASGDIIRQRFAKQREKSMISPLRKKDRVKSSAPTVNTKTSAQSFVVVERTSQLPSALHHPRSAFGFQSFYSFLHWVSRLTIGQLFILVWAVGSVCVLMPTLTSILRLRWLYWGARVVTDPEWAEVVLRANKQLNIHQSVGLREHSDIKSPITWGVFRPVILLPINTDGWSQERRYAVVLHELAHIQRGDVLTQLIARFIGAIFWLHPLAWWAIGQLRNEQEMACDDRVLTHDVSSTSYAQHLLDIARCSSQVSHRLEPAISSTIVAAGILSHSRLEDRMRAILDVRRSRRSLSLGTVLVASSVVFACLLPLSTAGVVLVVPENYNAGPVLDGSEATIIEIETNSQEESTESPGSTLLLRLRDRQIPAEK